MLSEKQMKTLGEALQENKKYIAEEVAACTSGKTAGGKISSEEAVLYRQEFIELVGAALSSSDLPQLLEEGYEWGFKTGTYACRRGKPLDDIMLSLPHYRNCIFEFIDKHVEDDNISFKAYNKLSNRINPMIDKITYAFSHAYVLHNEETFERAKEELLELSVPIVPLTKEVAILPLIGTLDTERAGQLMEKTLSAGSELGLSYLVIDLSGVHMIDTAVAQNLFQLHDALNLIGVSVIISGLRPAMAQTMVSLDISLKEMAVVRSLSEALALTGLQINNQVYN